MSELGDLLELLHGASQRWQTIRLVVRRWGDSDVSGAAIRRAAEQQRARGTASIVSARGTRGDDPTWESTTRAWLDRPNDRARTETDGPHGPRLAVQVGDRWWSYTPGTGSISNESEPETRGGATVEVEWLVDPSPLVAAFDFTPTGSIERAGRLALAAVAVPRPLDPRFGVGAPFVGAGADEVLLAVDRERGVVLQSEARLEGRPFARSEVLDVAFDVPFADDVFRFASPDGSPIRSPRQTFARPEPVSLEEAARRASFTVVVPTRVPHGWTLSAAYTPPAERPARPDSVTVSVLGGSHGARVTFYESGAHLPDALEWEELDYGGRLLLVRGQPPTGSPIEAKLEVDGTQVRANGNLDRTAFLEIVASLVPARRDLPPMTDR
jgi:outer membrane lipoprotein-sorting protein